MTKLSLTTFLFVTAFVTLSQKTDTQKLSASETQTKLVFNCKEDINEAFNGIYDRNADSNYWAVEALNINEFLSKNQGTSLADVNGVLPSASSFDNKFSDAALSLKTYPLFTNSSMVEGGSRYFNQYPTGWKMTDSSSPSTQAAWPSGYCSASTHYLKYYFNGTLHPGDGAAIAIYFKAPYSGTISIKDTVKVSSSNSDGVYQCVYTVPAIETKNYSWNSVGMHALYGGYPVYPTANVSPSSNWSTGWSKITTTSKKVEINDFIIGQGDYLVFIYASGPTNGYDTTIANPIITYDEQSVLNTKIEQEKETAVIKVKEYVNQADYRSAEQDIIKNIIDDASVKIEACTTLDDINNEVASARALLDEVKSNLDYVKEELLPTKTAAINSLSNYLNKDEYREEEKSSIDTILSEAKDLIDAALSEEEINNCVDLTKSKLLSVKKESTIIAEELNEYKRDAIDEIQSLVDLSNYDKIQKKKVEKTMSSCLEDILDATTIEEARHAFENGQNAINKISNRSPLIFVGIGSCSIGALILILAFVLI